jgi:type VI secretion system protein ImpM
VAIDVGFYGKLPSHGDFLRRRVSDQFVGVWDGWLQECLAASRAELGDRWLDIYLTSPAWRFACADGACGPAPLFGVMVPSVDRVGRYFPLTLVAELAGNASPFIGSVTRAEPFFRAAERLLIQTLESEFIELDQFDGELIQLGDRLETIHVAPAVVLESAGAVLQDRGDGWQIPISSPGELGSAFEQMLTQHLSAVYEPMVLWWTDGSSRVQPSCVIGKGLPHPDMFTAMLDGGWRERRWRSVAARIETAAQLSDVLIDDPTPPRFRSAAASNAGCVREINQDSFIERTDVGIWGVADGLGGHSDGEVASRMVCDALAEVSVGASFEELIAVVRQRVGDVNDQLIRAATRPVNAVQSGSTLVALLARGSSYAVLWAGDSRAYRWRDGGLEQLTRDHSLVALEGGSVDSHAITRAVGGEETLELDVVRERVHPGDRFLLCSDGLTRTVPDDRLAALLAHEDIAQAVDDLIKASLAAGAPDNVTALVVEAFA